jgi:hypothetical protein
MKECNRCHQIKDESEFTKSKVNKGGLRTTCRDCRTEEAREYRAKDPEKRKQVSREYNIRNKEKHAKKYQENKEDIKQKTKEHYKNNKPKISARAKVYREKHKVSTNERRRIYDANRRATDPRYKIRCLIKTNIKSGFKYFSKNGKTKSCKEYGIDIPKVFEKIGERPGSGKEWHLDHIIPCVVFNFDNPEHIKLAYSADNLRWYDCIKNIKKSDIIVWDLIEQSLELLEIANLLGIKKEHDGVDGKVLRKLFYPALPQDEETIEPQDSEDFQEEP